MTRTPNASKQTRALLLVLLESPSKWRHGYDLSLETKLKSGTLYPILMRLADQGLLESKWQESGQPGRPPRHTYRLSADGAALARNLASAEAPARFGRIAGVTA